jgi:hypothetical protein
MTTTFLRNDESRLEGKRSKRNGDTEAERKDLGSSLTIDVADEFRIKSLMSAFSEFGGKGDRLNGDTYHFWK